MKEIVERLTENRQVEIAKSILESNGYKVSKKSKILKESEDWDDWDEDDEYEDDSEILDSLMTIEEWADTMCVDDDQRRSYNKVIDYISKSLNSSPSQILVATPDEEDKSVDRFYRDFTNSGALGVKKGYKEFNELETVMNDSGRPSPFSYEVYGGGVLGNEWDAYYYQTIFFSR